MRSKPRRSTENNFITLLNFIADPAIIVDGKGRFLVVNDAFMDLTGLRKKELIGTAFLDLSVLTAENMTILFKNLEKMMKGVHVEPYEISFKNQVGETRYAEVKAKKIEYAGQPADLVVFLDITRRKENMRRLREYSEKMEKLVAKRNEQLKHARAKLAKSERLAAIGELAAMVGHDLRNPLTGIKGAAYYLKTKHGTELGAKGKEMLKSIENAINYSNKIVNDLLEYSRDLNLDLAEVAPKALLKNALSSLEVPDKIQIVDAIEYNFTVKADKAKMLRVFVNIIKNAIDAMPEGGILTVKSREVKGKLEITFKDTGTGMSEENLSKLKRGVPLFTTKAKGMGFGLPICRRIAEAHGGKISVESTAGKGTKVTVTIPVKPKPLNEDEEKWIFSESMLSAITATQGKT